MNQQLHAHFLPRLTADSLAGDTVVVIDVLRASTTICHALAARAVAVVPCREIDEARQLASASDDGSVLLAGERGGLPISGFQLGNSPTEYTSHAISGRTVVLTTTNGTQALEVCRQADAVLIGALVNLQAVCRRLADEPVVHLLCAGTDGVISRDDVLVAGAIAYTLHRQAETTPVENDSAQLARAAWRAVVARAAAQGAELKDHLAVELRATLGGRNLIAIGHEHDLAVAADLDHFDFVPVYDRPTGQIVLP